MGNRSESSNSAAVTAAIVGGIFVCVAAVIGLGQPFMERYADVYFTRVAPTLMQKSLLPPGELVATRKIVYVDNNNGAQDIYVMNEDGTESIRLTSGAYIDDFPEWSPDGRYIAFQSSRSGNDEIYIMDANGAQIFNVTNNESSETNPSWSPDSQKIVFVSDRNGYNDLFILNLMTGRLAQITETRNLSEQYPDWSPNGQYIVFSVLDPDNIGVSNLFVVNADGSNLRQLTNMDSVNITPAFSPDGQFIAFTSYKELTVYDSRVYMVDINGSKVTLLSPNGMWSSDPDWSTDSGHIIFGGQRIGTGASDLFVMGFDGSLVNLTNTPDRTETGPSWLWLSK